MEKNYSPAEFEARIYKKWLEKGYFHARVNPDKKPFTVMMPPPNVTGQLHVGHALNNAFPDAVVRYKRMKGFEALWMPGTDHASIATEVKIIEKLREEGTGKDELGREKFLERAWDWTRVYGGKIIEQLKRLGCGCDWDRLAFTMDEARARAVDEAFIRLYRDGSIYKGDRITNRCVVCKTALSDAEVRFETRSGSLWHIKYPVKGGGFITVATTRPETLFGDAAVAVNPSDSRYKNLVGKTVLLPLTEREIPIIADGFVDKKFGTGAVKITPAHDPEDFEAGLRHKLPVIRVINDDGALNENAGAFAGLERYAARKAALAELKRAGLLVKTQKRVHNAGHCDRCNSVVEPVVSRQWFVRMKDLAAPAIDAVTKKKIKFTPKRFEKIYLNWMNNIRDWCISRQLWWGHRIPAFTCASCGAVSVGAEPPEKCACGGAEFTRDEDVLDTWFSSALWPFSTLNWPDETPELKYFYPTDLLVTGYDIIFFWVARMIFSSLRHTGEIPFKEVCFTGLVRDMKGRKMSKSLGNGVDPLELIDAYGADSLRFSLLSGVSAGGDMRYDREKTEAARNFINKLWNAARFFTAQTETYEGGFKPLALKDCALSPADKWILARLNAVVKKATRLMDAYNVAAYCAVVYDFLWGDFCDWYIELLKPSLYSGDAAEKRRALSVFYGAFGVALKILHPVVPFVTEELFGSLYGDAGSLVVAAYPEFDKKYSFPRAVAEFDGVREFIKSVRALRAELNVPQNKRARLYILPLKGEKLLKECLPYIKALTSASEAEFIASRDDLRGGSVGVCVSDIARGFVYTGELVDFKKEAERLKAEIAAAEGELARAEGKLRNEGFMSKAPRELAEAERRKAAAHRERIERLRETLAKLPAE